MATQETRPITFVIPGLAQTSQAAAGATRGAGGAAAAALPGQVKASVRVGAQRGAGEPVRVSAVPGEDVVALHIAGGPVLFLHPATARDLMLAQGSAKRGAPGAAAADEVAVTPQLRWRGLEQAAPTRGFMGDVVLAAFEVLTGFTKDRAVQFVASEVVRHVDSQVDAGVYALEAKSMEPLKGSGRRLTALPAAGGPLLVLIHGTFVETTSTFKKLWVHHPRRVQALFEHYGGHVYALDHPTLGASPIANALTLVRACPKGARLHLATHSRGGLVAEVLARMAHQRAAGAADLAVFPGVEYAGQRAELEALAAEMKARDIRVERVVRVACPARGTLLASKRLDAYLSVLKWALELVKVPVAPTLVNFLAEVARRRADPREIPGLAAMMPESPLVNWLNGVGSAPAAIAGDLRVIAGDLKGDSIGGWIKTLLADAFYWGDNDIVVHTRSMYAGTPRAGGASFMLDQGGNSTHFNYFANESTAAAFVDGLLNAAPPAAFFTIGPLSWAGQDAAGRRGRAGAGDAAAAAVASAERPAVFVLPGILGSHLKAQGDRIWLAVRLIGGLDRLAYQPGGADGVEPDGPIGMVYDDLVEHLAQSHEVIPFAFDWRRPIEDEARRLADAVLRELDQRNASGQPVRLLAHSMGGLVARTMQLERPEVWKRMMARPGARLLMLGTPNGGSWAPMQVLSGDDTFGNALAAFGSGLLDYRARGLMAAMPGLMQLQAGLTDARLGLDNAQTWSKLAGDDYAQSQLANWWHRSEGSEMEPAYRWGVPTQAALDQARALRARLDRQRDQDLAGFADKLVLVVGQARFTPAGFEVGEQGFVYLDATDGGDGRVTLDSALLPGVATWTLGAEHGSLPSERKAFDAFVELLERGQTQALERLDPPAATAAARRGGSAPAAAPALVRSRPSRESSAPLPAGSGAVLFGTRAAVAPAARGSVGAALRVVVLNGDLSFIRQPLMVGHYRSLELTGTERALDRLVGGAMKASLALGLYPEPAGTHQLFANVCADAANPWSLPRPAAAIIVGLGEEGTLTEQGLVATVRQGTIAWAQRAAESPGGAPAGIALAATLIGSGGVGISAGAAARAIVRGVREANQRLADDRGDAAADPARGWPVVTELTLVEMYLDRASEAWRGVRVLQTSDAALCQLDTGIQHGNGARRRTPDSGYRGAEYDLVRIATDADDGIEFTLDTRRARTEVRAEKTQGKLLRELVSRAAQHGRNDPVLGRTLFQLLVPVEVEPFLGGTDRMVLDLDEGTAAIPWELLDTGAGSAGAAADQKPWAIRSQLLRKLRKREFRSAVRDAIADDAVLVIGEPKAPEGWGALPGARAEAAAVHAALTGPGGIGAERVTALLGDANANEVINALLERPYRIVHVAGHGDLPDEKAGTTGGVVLSGGTFLGPLEIKKMRTVPELVFVNCCHLAAHDSQHALREQARFAASVADQLITIGVRCVVAAGWEVDDGPAKVFATTFYARLLAGANFITAVGAAREAAWTADPTGKTWAAYQCYGDPGWFYAARVRDAQAPARPLGDEFDGISSQVGLALALEDIAIQGARGDAQALQEKLRHLADRFGPRWGGAGAVAEAFGVAWEAARGRDEAIAWFERALAANDASASMKTAESLNNLRVRRAWERVAPGARSAKARRATPSARALVQSRREIERSRTDLLALARLQPTIERWSLVGSAHKRIAMLEELAGRPAQATRAVRDTHDAYAHAEQMAAEAGHPELFYPALNRMGAAIRLGLAEAGWAGLDRARVALAQQSLAARHDADPNFWSATAMVEMALLEVLSARTLATREEALLAGFADVHRRRSSPGNWESVAQQAQFVLGPYAKAMARGGHDREARAALTITEQLLAYATA